MLKNELTKNNILSRFKKKTQQIGYRSNIPQQNKGHV